MCGVSHQVSDREEKRIVTTYSLEETLKAQRALRKAAGLGDEQFPVEGFVRMISDEDEALRKSPRKPRPNRRRNHPGKFKYPYQRSGDRQQLCGT